jgi:hypothetical protein
VTVKGSYQRSANACRTLDQHGQRRFMVERDAPGGLDRGAAGMNEAPT